MALTFSEPDVTIMRLPFNNIWVYVRASYAEDCQFRAGMDPLTLSQQSSTLPMRYDKKLERSELAVMEMSCVEWQGGTEGDVNRWDAEGARGNKNVK